MTTALIGYTGFVGSTLLRQGSFDALYRSTNIGEIDGQSFGTVVCAGAQAKKWLANRDPEADKRGIEVLISHLQEVSCENFVLISTVDVFDQPGVDERTPIDQGSLQPYGRHRRLLELFVMEHFKRHLIVRLPGLVGPGLRKNVIFDFLNGNNLDQVDSRGVFQFYPAVNLLYDIRIALAAGLDTVHLTAEPISVARVAGEAFGLAFHNHLGTVPARYDMRTIHADLFGASGDYQYTSRDCLTAIRAYAQSEARRGSEP